MDWWDWLGIIMGSIGVVAFVMVIQPFIQMICGQPKIVMLLSEDPKELNGFSILECFIYNNPITRGILNTFRISRNTAIGLIATFTIEDRHTGDKVHSEWPDLFSQVGEATQRVDLPAGYVPARFAVVTMDETQGVVYPGLALPSKQQVTQRLAVGAYIVAIEVELGGKVVSRMGKTLIVQAKSPHAYWISV